MLDVKIILSIKKTATQKLESYLLDIEPPDESSFTLHLRRRQSGPTLHKVGWGYNTLFCFISFLLQHTCTHTSPFSDQTIASHNIFSVLLRGAKQ